MSEVSRESRFMHWVCGRNCDELENTCPSYSGQLLPIVATQEY